MFLSVCVCVWFGVVRLTWYGGGGGGVFVLCCGGAVVWLRWWYVVVWWCVIKCVGVGVVGYVYVFIV